MIKFIMITAILLAGYYSEASYDVSFLTIKGIPTIEVIKNGKKCYIPVEDFDKLTSDQIVKLVNKQCKLK